MSQPMLVSTGCRLARHQASPATLFLQQYRRAVVSSGPSINASPQSASYHSIRPIQSFLLPSKYCRASRRAEGLLLRPSVPSNRISQFSTTAPSRATTVVLNPRVDDDGKPMLIEISPRAAKRLREITDNESSAIPGPLKGGPYDHLRVTVSSGGCHGFQYLMTLDPASKIDQEEDTVFEADPADAEKSPTSGDTKGEAKVVMDSASLELLRGSTVDYTTELIGSQFKITNNPRATSNCGCGTSFDVTEP